MQLTEQQRQAVDHRGHLAVIAGPGSGKTRVLTEKIVALIKEGAAPAAIAAVTFTREGAGEIRNRVEARCGPRAGRAVRVGTFHSICREQLLKANRARRLIEPGAWSQLMRTLVRHHHHRYSFDEIQKMVEQVKSQDAPVEPDDERGEAGRVTALYEKALSKMNRCDYQDLLRDALNDMRSGIVKPLKIEHLLMDEYQDADPIQHAWGQFHAGVGVKLMAVGDDDQSIYGWRNAMGFHGMRRFIEALDADVIELGVNFRSTPQIVATAQRVIQANTERLNKVLSAHSDATGTIATRHYESAAEEAQAIVSWATDTAAPEVAVLTRTNGYLDAIERALLLAGIKTRRYQGVSVGSRPHVLGYLDLLDFIVRGHPDSLQLIGKTAKLKLAAWAQHARRQGAPETVAELCKRPDAALFGDVPPLLEVVVEFADRVASWREAADIEPNFTAFAAAMWWAEYCSAAERDELLELAQRLDGLGASLDERVETMRGRLLQTHNEDDPPKVHLLTVHRAKGLEFDEVWVGGIAKGTMPLHNAPLDEERRLLYVAMTRAKSALMLSMTGEDRSMFCKEIHAALDHEEISQYSTKQVS